MRRWEVLFQVWAERTQKGKKSCLQALEAHAYMQKQTGEKTKMPLKCCFVSLAVAYFTAEEFEVLHFLGVLQEQQS